MQKRVYKLIHIHVSYSFDKCKQTRLVLAPVLALALVFVLAL